MPIPDSGGIIEYAINEADHKVILDCLNQLVPTDSRCRAAALPATPFRRTRPRRHSFHFHEKAADMFAELSDLPVRDDPDTPSSPPGHVSSPFLGDTGPRSHAEPELHPTRHNSPPALPRPPTLPTTRLSTFDQRWARWSLPGNVPANLGDALRNHERPCAGCTPAAPPWSPPQHRRVKTMQVTP